MNIDVIRLAREAGIEWQQHTGVIGRISVTTCGSQSVERLERFAALVAAEERQKNLVAASEACRAFGKSGAVLMAAIRAKVEQ